MTLIHKTRMAIPYIGRKGRKVAWVEEWDTYDTFIPKYRPPNLPVHTPKKSKYHAQIREYQQRLRNGEQVIEITSDEPSKLRRCLTESAKQIAPELKFITITKESKVMVVRRKEK